MISIGYKQVRKVTAVVVILPVIVFLAGFLRPLFAAAGVLTCLAALWFVLRDDNTDPLHDNKIGISRRGLLGLAFVMLLWGYLGGLNGFFYQSDDWWARNAIYRDLITHRWPVVYDRKITALVYYIGHWLVPAALAKPVYHFLGADIGWFAARMFLWVWTAFITFLVSLHLMIYTRAVSRRKKLICLVCFIGFSGMDLLGALVSGNLGEALEPGTLHLEWWYTYQFSSLTTCLYWVFNQAVIPWLVVTCVLFERDPRNYLFWGVSCLLCGPFPFVGVVILMAVRAGMFAVSELKEKQWKRMLCRIFSPGNLLLLAVVFPAVALYILANNAAAAGVVSSTSADAQESAGWIGQLAAGLLRYLRSGIIRAFAFDVGAYLLLLFWRNRREPVFYAAAISLFVLPYIRIGSGGDFAMRTTIPAIFVLMVFLTEEAVCFSDHWRECRVTEKLRGLCLLAVFLTGLATPAVEVFRGVYNVYTNGTILLENTPLASIGDLEEASLNFEASDFADSPFFAKLAKRPRTDSVSVGYGDGFFAPLPLTAKAAEPSFRLAEEGAELTLYNGYPEPAACELQMVFGISEKFEEPYTVFVTCGEQTFAYEISGEAQTVTVPVTLEETVTKVLLTSDKIQPGQGPEHEQYFSVSGARLYDGAGTLLAGEEAQHPELESEAEQLEPAAAARMA